MNLVTPLLRGLFLSATSLYALFSAHGATSVLFEDTTDLNNFVITNSGQANTEAVNTNELTMPLSQLDGDAIRMWDFDSAGRSTLRYIGASGNTAGMLLSFDVYIGPESTGNLLVRIGNDRASMAGIKGSGFSLVLQSTGIVAAEVANLAGGGWKAQPYDVAEPGVPFNVTMVLNTAMSSNLSVPYDETDVTLGPQTWALFIDNALVATDLPALTPAATGDATFNYNPAGGVWNIWWLTGSATPDVDIDFQLDNIYTKTGEDIRIGLSETDPVDPVDPVDPLDPEDTFAGYAIFEGGFVDTGSWLGLLFIGAEPWIWSYTLNSWLYMEEPEAGATGAWAYILSY